MASVSNTIVAIFNILFGLLSLAAIATSLYFYMNGVSACQKYLQSPLLITGVVLFAVSLLGLIGSCGKINFFLYIYLTMLFLCILGISAVTVFAFIVTNEGAGKALSGRGYKEYRLGDYSNWLQKHVVDGKKWDEIKSCMVDAQVCQSLRSNVPRTAAEFYKTNLSPIQSGCCKPPAFCGFEYKNATYWTVPKSGPAVPDSDCTTWSNDQKALCYDCKSCKGGFLANIRREWRTLLLFNLSVLGFTVVIYSIGCCASRNNRSDRKYGNYRYRGYP